MTGTTEVTVAMVVATIALAGLILTQNAGLRREMDTLRRDIGDIRSELRDLHGRIARIEGVLVGPRPVDLPPPPASSDNQEAA